MILERNGEPLFPLGMYERPRDDDEWTRWSAAGINLVRCGSREDLDRAQAAGMFGWVPVSMVLADDDDGSALAARIDALRDHPALAAWEAPDEAIWNTWRLDDKGRPIRLWKRPDDVAAELQAKMEATIRGLERGARLVRQRDPGRKIWLNEACMSDYDSLARCLPALDIVGFDYYPVPNEQARPMEWTGAFTERFRRTAPTKDVWVVEQAFSWSNLFKDRGIPEAHPTAKEARFMAWQAIARGATGLLWWGSSYEDRPAPFLDELMGVVSEFAELHPFLFVGNSLAVQATVDPKRFPAAMGVSCLARRAGDKQMLVLVNEDPYEHDVILRGPDVRDPNTMRPIVEAPNEFVRLGDGYVTVMDGYEVRIYVTG